MDDLIRVKGEMAVQLSGDDDVLAYVNVLRAEVERLMAENARLWAILAQMPCAGEQAAMAGGCGTCPSCEARAKEGK